MTRRRAPGARMRVSEVPDYRGDGTNGSGEGTGRVQRVPETEA
ncbi:MAG: hypothetical protein ACREXW_20585 [Gammaproteobacteria bacterium]